MKTDIKSGILCGSSSFSELSMEKAKKSQKQVMLAQDKED